MYQDEPASAQGTLADFRARLLRSGMDRRLLHRTVSNAPDEKRQQFRPRVRVEHRLARLVYRQGDRARYLGVRKNLFELLRASAIHNLETLHRAASPLPRAA